MRWTKQSEGNKRTRTGFLLFPKCIKGEWRWWERATWREEYYGSYADCWAAVEWVNE